MRESNLLYSKFADFNVNLIQKHPHRTSRMMFDHISGLPGPAKLIFKINYHHCGSAFGNVLNISGDVE